ncbi:PAS domain-containing protein [Pseudonocardia abyssalis]|uniref:PAS domain-containing protein n=3 Tax=Pseudonocardia abyssalis TaxID=2792008 RepID=A0ABS6UP23_9PSEU|nr:PAS domain-containing protein [Pseudonocardia abyssalis]MBW0134002.1 PAS domain-containing protein [Pseudonocardia abyssalis]
MSDDPGGNVITWVSDPTGARTALSPAWRSATGADPAGDLGSGWQRRVHPRDLPGHLDRTAAARAAGTGWTATYRLLHTGGTVQAVREHAVAVDGSWAGVVVPDTDGADPAATGAAFRLLAEHADDVIGRHTADGRWLWISPSVQRVVGYRPDDVIGLHPRDLVHPDDAGRLDAALTALTDDEPAELTLRLRCSDGTHRWFALHARRVRNDRTGAVEVHTSLRDVTDQLLAQEELGRFRGLADRAADLIGIAAADGTVLYLNPAGREMLGFPGEHPLDGLTMPRTVAPADRKRFAGVIAEVDRTGTWSGSMRLVDTAGIMIPVWLAAAAHPDHSGRTAFYSAVAQDLRERRGGEPALQQERERYRILVAQAPVGIWVADRTGATTFVNDHMAEITGRDAAGLAGADHIHPDDRAALADSWSGAVTRGSAWRDEFRIVTPAGEVRTVTSTARPLHDAVGTVTGFLGTTTDVTEQRAAEHDRREAAGQQAARLVSDAAAARLRAMIGGLTAIVWEADWDPAAAALRFTFVSDRAEELLGHPSPRWLDDPGFWPGVIHPDDRADTLAFTADRTAGGFDHDLTYRARTADGRTVWLHQVVHVVGGGGSPVRAQGLTVDVTEQRRAERSSEILAETGRLMAETGSVEQKLDALVRLVAHDFGEAAVVSLAGPDGLLRRAAVAHPEDPAGERALLRLPPAAPGPRVLEVAADGVPVVLPPADAPEGHHALTVPLRIEGRFAGVLSFLALGPVRHHDHAVLELAAELGRRTSLMLEADRRRTRERQLQRVTADLATADTVDEAGRRLVERLRDILGADAASMYRVDAEHGVLRSVIAVGYADELRAQYATIRADADVPLALATRTGQASWIRDREEWALRFPDLLGPAVAGGRHACATLPLLSRGIAVGAVYLSFATPRIFPADEQAFALAMAAQAAPALERAVAADERRVIAETLQNSLLPPTLPDLDRLSLAARYLPGAQGTRAGGDWYDVLPLDGGRVAIAVGDVVGQGTRAAAVMGQLRSALAAYLLEGHDPAGALGHLDRFARRVPGAAGSTVTCLVLDPVDGVLTWARAGHPPPLVLGPGGPRLLEDATGTVLAVRGRPPYVAGTARLAPGDSIVLYTDGLVERRGEVVDDGLERLCAAGEKAHPLPPAALAEALLAAGLDDGPTDDVALIVARLTPAPLLLDLPADGDELRGLRRAVARWTAEIGLDPDESYDLQLALGEAAANSVEHAYRGAAGPGRMQVRLARDGATRIAVTVRDGGVWRPPPTDPGHRGRGLTLISEIGDDVHLEHGADGTEIRFSVPAVPRPPDPPAPAPPPGAVADGAGPTRLRIRRTAAAERIAVAGDLDPSGAASVGPALLAAARADGPALVLDLRATTYLSSAGIALLAEVVDTATQARRALRLDVTASGAIGRALALSGLSRLAGPA